MEFRSHLLTYVPSLFVDSRHFECRLGGAAVRNCSCGIRSEGIVHFNYCRSRYGSFQFGTELILRSFCSFFAMFMWNLCKGGGDISVAAESDLSVVFFVQYYWGRLIKLPYPHCI